MSDRKLGPLLERIAHRDETQVVAVSGGRDSIALLDMLVRDGATRLIVAHLDHALRAGSGDDAKFVRSLARKYNLPIVIERCAVRERARRQKQSLETAAREARYDFLARTARKHGARRLLLAHHADDQVETFLLNLFRGAGTSGLGAMRLQSNRIIGDSELIIERPLLGVWREEIDAYIAKHQLTFREDPTNIDREHLRNRVRHDLLPALEHLFGRKLRQTIWRAAEMLRAEDEWMRTQVPALKRELSVATLRELPIPLQRRLLHQWLASERVPDIGYELVERVRDLLSNRTAKTNLPGGRHVRRRAGKLFIEGAHGA